MINKKLYNGKYKDYVKFCKATGLRKTELESLQGSAFYKNKDGKSYLHVTKNTKGGRYREVPILKEYSLFVENICKKAGAGKVIPYIAENRLKAPNGADTHSYRADYAKELYNRLKRPLDKILPYEKYFYRGDLKGLIHDKKAMEVVSQALGHTRISIIAQSYLI